MKKWQYLTHTINLAEEPCNSPDDGLNKLGEEGWDVIGFTHDGARTHYLFKRLKQEGERQYAADRA